MSLQKIRKNIDLLDAKILKLLNDRMELGLMARKFKTTIEDTEREKEVLERIRRNSTGLINAEFIERVYKEIIKENKNLQQNDFELIAFQGEHGAYGEVASREWNDELVPVPCNGFAEIFEGVESGLFDYGIVPMENTLGGVVGQVNQLLINTQLNLVGAVELPISLCLLVIPGTDHREIRTVYAHSQALAQCRGFLTRNKLEGIQYAGSASAAKMLAENAPKASAVIASRLAAALYNLEVMKEDIEDIRRNMTRFLILSREQHQEGGDKCSVLFTTEHKAGTLFRVLEIFARNSISLTRIESVPNEAGSYVFFVDFIGSDADEKVITAIEEVRSVTVGFRLMGSYREKTIGPG
jgi:prephenate dehydratase/chorismate mutase/prephenate dehydratase